MSDSMSFYLAARYSRREELLGVRDVIQALGGTVTSRWLNGSHQIDDQGVPIGDDGEQLVEDPDTNLPAGDDPRAVELRQHFATEDVADVRRADVLIAFTEPPRSTATRGGRHVELGMALALRKRVIVVGPRENVFTWLPEVEHFPGWSTAALHVVRMLDAEVPA